MNDITTIDTPGDLTLSSLERKIVERLASGVAAKSIAIELGIPRIAITNLMRRQEVSEFITEVIDARNQLLKLQIVDTIAAVFEDKVAANAEDEEARLADLTRKDIVDVARTLNDLIKTSDSTAKEEAEDRMTQIYNQINVIQNEGKDK